MRIKYFQEPKKIYHINSFLTSSDIEIKDITKAWLAISIAFGLVLGGLTSRFFFTFAISAVAVGLGFLLHELSHKYFAQKYGYKAEFRSFDEMLFLAIIMGFFGFVIAAPGAVMIFSRVIDKKKNGIISVAGPIMNIILAMFFFAIAILFTGSFQGAVSLMNQHIFEILKTSFFESLLVIGFIVNSWLALFNMIPFWLFDGRKVFSWNKAVWVIVVFIAAYFTFFV